MYDWPSNLWPCGSWVISWDTVTIQCSVQHSHSLVCNYLTSKKRFMISKRNCSQTVSDWRSIICLEPLICLVEITVAQVYLSQHENRLSHTGMMSWGVSMMLRLWGMFVIRFRWHCFPLLISCCLMANHWKTGLLKALREGDVLIGPALLLLITLFYVLFLWLKNSALCVWAWIFAPMGQGV